MTDDDRPGAVLARLKWAKTTTRQRKAHGKLMANARWSAYRAERAAREEADRAECALRLAGAQKP
jgi:hypothetical protein